MISVVTTYLTCLLSYSKGFVILIQMKTCRTALSIIQSRLKYNTLITTYLRAISLDLFICFAPAQLFSRLHHHHYLLTYIPNFFFKVLLFVVCPSVRRSYPFPQKRLLVLIRSLVARWELCIPLHAMSKIPLC